MQSGTLIHFGNSHALQQASFRDVGSKPSQRSRKEAQNEARSGPLSLPSSRSSSFSLRPTNASATVNCQEVYRTETTYPEGPYSFYCGTASIANATQMVTAATQTHGTATGEVRRANGGVVFYLFHNPYEYKQNFPQSQGYPAPGLTDFGVLYLDPQNIPVFVAIFEMNASGQNNFSFAYTTGQQVGRSLDSLLGYIKDGGIVPPTLFKVSDGGRSLGPASSNPS